MNSYITERVEKKVKGILDNLVVPIYLDYGTFEKYRSSRDLYITTTIQNAVLTANDIFNDRVFCHLIGSLAAEQLFQTFQDCTRADDSADEHFITLLVVAHFFQEAWLSQDWLDELVGEMLEERAEGIDDGTWYDSNGKAYHAPSGARWQTGWQT